MSKLIRLHGFVQYEYESEFGSNWVSAKTNFRCILKQEEKDHLPGGRDCCHRRYPVKKQTNKKVNAIFLAK